VDWVYTDDLEGTQEARRDVDRWSRICDIIETHMGIWTKDKETGVEMLKVPETKAQLFMHMCDFLASRPSIEVDTVEREPQSKDYYKKEEAPWRKDPATAGQIEYVRKLMIMCIEKKIQSPVDNITIADDNGNIVYTKGKATDDIDALKKALGIS
jgi:hypothetical protein